MGGTNSIGSWPHGRSMRRTLRSGGVKRIGAWTDQRPRWEGPPENRPRGYLPAIDDPARNKDAAGDSLTDPVKSDLSDAFKTKRPKKALLIRSTAVKGFEGFEGYL